MNRKLQNIKEYYHRKILYLITQQACPLSIGIYSVDDDLIEIVQYQVRDGRIVATDVQPRDGLPSLIEVFHPDFSTLTEILKKPVLKVLRENIVGDDNPEFKVEPETPDICIRRADNPPCAINR